MKHVEASNVHQLLDYAGLVDALEAAHARDVMPQAHAQIFQDPGTKDNFVSLIAWESRRSIAVKLVGVFPANTSLPEPEPSVQGLVALFSGETGAPLMTCDGAALTFRKTAADSALGARYLARKDARVLLVVGAGGLAPHVIEAHRAVRPTIERVLIWNRNPARAQRLKDDLFRDEPQVSVADDLDEALPEADVISCVTMATAPLVKGALLKRGAHVDLIGAYTPEMREADDDVVRRAGRMFVDTREGCEGSGDVADPISRGLITREQIEADLFDLATGRHKGRRSEDEITVYKNAGGGHLDLFTIRHLYARA
ncbi:ornithine cyclodeaminase [soil metagenome]